MWQYVNGVSCYINLRPSMFRVVSLAFTLQCASHNTRIIWSVICHYVYLIYIHATYAAMFRKVLQRTWLYVDLECVNFLDLHFGIFFRKIAIYLDFLSEIQALFMRITVLFNAVFLICTWRHIWFGGCNLRLQSLDILILHMYIVHFMLHVIFY